MYRALSTASESTTVEGTPCYSPDLATATGMKVGDVLYTLQDHQILVPFYNGTEHTRLPPEFFAPAEPYVPPALPEDAPPPNDYRLAFQREDIVAYIAKHDARAYVRLDPSKLRWTPFLHTRPLPAPKTEEEGAVLDVLEEAHDPAAAPQAVEAYTEPLPSEALA